MRPLGDHFVAYARGCGGQLIYVIPEAGVVVASSVRSDGYMATWLHGYMATLHALVEKELLGSASM